MDELPQIRAAARAAAQDPDLISRRFDLARQTAAVFQSVGEEFLVAGSLIGGDRVTGTSQWGNGSDETVAVALLFLVGADLVAGCSSLFAERRHYAGAALIRQLVEVEYLAWAFETRDRDGERWLRSTREERDEFFRPVRLREAAAGRFKGRDYGYHCELGGHPVPRAEILFRANACDTAQLLLSDALGHAGRIWDHLRTWAKEHRHLPSVEAHGPEMGARYRALWADDPLVHLPPPP
ncbi:MAG TPA: hypothetical protein VHK47_02005 [Polyangia bacterium]|nr:hypothetical protein [Polyangia bacterium]